MKYKQLECLCALAETLNFSKAAEMVFITQPAFSKNIAALEEELGCLLVNRKRKDISLTDTGELVYARARVIKEQIEAIEKIAEQNSKGEMNSIIIGTMWGGLHEKERKLIRAYSDTRADLQIELNEFTDRALYNAIEVGVADIGISIGHLSQKVKNEFNYLTIQQNKTCLICSQNHPLAHRTSIAISELKNEKFLTVKRDKELYSTEYLERLCISNGFEAQISYIADSIFIMLDLVEEDKGVAILGDDATMISQRKINAVPIEAAMPSSHTLLWRKDDNRKDVNDIVEFIKRNVNNEKYV